LISQTGLTPEIAAVYEGWNRFAGEMEMRLLQKYSKNDIALFTRILKDAADYDGEAALR